MLVYLLLLLLPVSVVAVPLVVLVLLVLVVLFVLVCLLLVVLVVVRRLVVLWVLLLHRGSSALCWKAQGILAKAILQVRVHTLLFLPVAAVEPTLSG